ncbi:hypothetical protein N7537_008872 [Penicillium hordei]|uniref:Transcription factor domain-containing protein n=1 Tax=Penicillium hordei TaxID=40994 RepID=A0AAD6H226_9EURO|nr:uncharacterized protein N7537_008872 [Penicillium hordei]KAJ5598788.1 hypothetical protein N7537_008872 [Penicillium hordei]
MAPTIQNQRNINFATSEPSQSNEMNPVSLDDTSDEIRQASLDLNAPLPDTWPPFDLENMQFTEDTIADDLWSYPNETGSSLPWDGDITQLLELETIQSLPTGFTSTSDQSIPKHLDPIQHTKNKSSPSAASSQSHSTSSERVWPNSSNEDERLMSLNLDNRLYSPSHLIFGHTFTVGLGRQIRTDPNNLCQEILKHLREYPSLILDRDFWSPFVHHTLYRCSLGRMAPPMADALACVGAYASTAGSGSGFVDRMISGEREKLVRNFHGYTATPEFCLAAMHAVCIYQILGLFGDSFLPAAVKKPMFSNPSEEPRQEFERSAELYSSFLLKMTRRLSTIHSNGLQIHHDDENDWNQWKFMESLRRNVFFVHIINILESKTKKLNENYFEPLNDNMILRLPLPAPEQMWRACSAEEWMLARVQTLGCPISSKPPRDGGGATLRTLGNVLQEAHAGKVDVASLLPLTRMILASAIISPPGNASF